MGNTSSSAARPSRLRNVRRVSRERLPREDRLPSAIVVMEITRSATRVAREPLGEDDRVHSTPRPFARWNPLEVRQSRATIEQCRPGPFVPGCEAREPIPPLAEANPLWGHWYRAARPARRAEARGRRPERWQARDGRQSPFPIASSDFPCVRPDAHPTSRVKGNRPASIRGPSNASTAGTRVFVSNTLIPATRNPATPMERTSLMGTVKRARNPMATVEAEIRSV